MAERESVIQSSMPNESLQQPTFPQQQQQTLLQQQFVQQHAPAVSSSSNIRPGTLEGPAQFSQQLQHQQPHQPQQYSGVTTAWPSSTPIFPHMGQLISTPIGPSVPPVQPVAASSITSPITAPMTATSIPVYSGFANTTSDTTKMIPSTAQFFYQDLPQLVPVPPSPIQQSTSPQPLGVPSSPLLLTANILENTALSTVPVLAPPNNP